MSAVIEIESYERYVLASMLFGTFRQDTNLLGSAWWQAHEVLVKRGLADHSIVTPLGRKALVVQGGRR